MIEVRYGIFNPKGILRSLKPTGKQDFGGIERLKIFALSL